MLRFDALDTGSDHRLAQLAAYGNVGEAMHLFGQLLHNKNFLLTFLSAYANGAGADADAEAVHALASLVCLSLRDNLPYLYSIIKSLLADQIRIGLSGGNTKSSKCSKALFRSHTTEQMLVESLIVNWLAMFMFDFQRDTQCATHLYRLVRALGHYVHAGPVDAVQQKALNSLSEERLLLALAADTTLTYQTLYVNVVLNGATATKGLFVVPLVDLDTVEQAKDKCLDVVARHGGFGSGPRPSSRDVDLELCLIIIPSESAAQAPHQQATANTSTMITLRDTEDELFMHQNNNHVNSTGSSKRLLTVKDYNIQSGAFLNLSVRPIHSSTQHHHANNHVDQQNQHVYMSTMSMGNEYQVYASSSSSSQSAQPLLGSTPVPFTSTTGRYHLVQSGDGASSPSPSSSCEPTSTSATVTAARFSTTASTSSSSCAGDATSSKKKSTAAAAAKKYEKLLTVKSQDSAVTTASLIASSDDSSVSTPPAPARSAILSRLLLNKGTIQPFIDQFVESVLTSAASLPPVVQHLFEFIDAEVRKYVPAGPGDSAAKQADEISRQSRSWKSNMLFVRYWARLIRCPSVLFDLRTSTLVDSSLECIAQALIDSCSTVDAHNLYDTESASNRLLFIREVPRYKLMIEQFTSELRHAPPVSDHELHFYMNEFGKLHPGLGDHAQLQVLLKCYALYERCETQCNQALGQQQCSILLPVHHRLVQIKELMANPIAGRAPTAAPVTNPTATLNASYLSQLMAAAAVASSSVNTYATTADLSSMLPTSANHNFHQSQQYF